MSKDGINLLTNPLADFNYLPDTSVVIVNKMGSVLTGMPFDSHVNICHNGRKGPLFLS